MTFLDDIKSRGLLAQITHEEELAVHLSEKRRFAYAGFDPTADSLHVGHLLPIMGLRRWQKAGHGVIALVGGGTAMVGDPTGKTDMRQMMTVDEIDRRALRIKHQLSPLIDFTTAEKGIMVNNADWLRHLEYLPFLRDFGSHFSVNRMLTAESVKQRLEKGLSFLEFNYMILQSYDFYHLHKNYGCTVQMGGDDQWSNMLGGMELVRRKSRDQAFCVTMPLLVSSSGKKMGKTEQGAVWLDPDMTPPYDLFQYFRNVDDDMVEKCLNYFTDHDPKDIAAMTSKGGAQLNEAKVVLGYEVTKLLHGEEEAKKARDRASALFTGGGDLKALAASAPQVTLTREDVQKTSNLVDLLVLGKIFQTKSEVRRMIEQGGLSMDEEKVTDLDTPVPLDKLSQPEGVLIRKGKKLYFNLRISP